MLPARPPGDHRICTLQAGSSNGLDVEVPKSSEAPEGGAGTDASNYEVVPTNNPKTQLKGVRAVRWVETPLADKNRPLHRLYTEAVEQGRAQQAKEIISQIVPELRGIEILTEQDRPVLHLVYEGGSVPVAVAGDGVNALVRICLELAALPGGVVLIEEPELHQHPAAIRQTARAVLAAVRRDIQVVMTTHSLELIDALLGEAGEQDKERLAVFRLSLVNGTIRSRRIPGPEAAFLRGEIESDLR